MTLQVQLFPLIGASSALAIAAAKYSTIPTSTALAWAIPAAILFWTVWSSYIYPFYLSPLRHIPTVPGFPLWGQFFTIITTEIGVAARGWHEEHGPLVRYFFPFGSERLSVTGDEDIKHMCHTAPYNFPKPDRARAWMRPILGDGVLLAEGHTHVVQRKALTPAFSITSIRSLMPVFWAKSLHMSQLWEEEIHTDKVQSKCFEVLEWLNRTTLDIIGKAGLGTDIDSLDNPDTPLREAYRLCFSFDLQARIVNGLAAFTSLIRYLPMKANTDMMEARRAILSRAQLIINEKQAQAQASKNDQTPSRIKDIIGLIVRDNMKAAKGDTLTVEAMRDQVMTFLGAGHDTTATSAAWTLLMLAKNQDVQTKLRAEIKQAMPFLFDETLRYDEDSLNSQAADVDRLPYLEDVCKESLRYIPSIPMTVRRSINDDQLGGHFIPAGTTVYLMANTINRLKCYWGETADDFDPSRWRNLPSTYTANAFMTFLQGPRGCVGRKFAEVEMKTILCAALSKFTFDVDTTVQDPEELKMWRLVLRPRDGVSLRVTPLETST